MINILKKLKNIIQTWWQNLSQDTRSAFSVSAVSLSIIAFLCPYRIGKSSPKEIFYYFLRNIFEAAFLFFIILTITFTVSLFKRKIKELSKVFFISWCITLLLSLPYMPRLLGYGTTQIGDFYEYSEYTENYIVYLSREPKEIKNRKQYTLTAEISRYEDKIGETDEGRDITTLNYHINYLYFNNGGYLYFGSDSTILYLNKETKVTDYNDDTYYITLTDQKSNKTPKTIIKAKKEDNSPTVYITEYGEKYHKINCLYIFPETRIKTTLDEAKDNGYSPCSVCKP